MPTMQDVRAKYPQYDDMSDAELAGKLHAKFYADIPRAEFDAKLGLVSQGSVLDASQREAIDRGKANAAAGIRPKAGPHHPEIAPAPMPQYGGAAMNATAGANEGLYGVLGAPVDLMAGAMNLGIRGYNAATGSEVGTIDEPFGGSRSIGRGMGAVAPQLDPQNTTASTTGERIARGLGEGAGYALAPEAVLAALTRSGAIGGRAADMAGQMFGRATSTGAVAGNAAVGAASGAGASAAMEAAPDEYRPLAGMMGGLLAGGTGVLAAGVPGLVRGGVRIGQDAIAPMTAAGRERIAAETLREASSNPVALRASLDRGYGEIVPGSAPTTFQQTGDMGLGGLERGIASKRPELFNQRRADQNAARMEATESLQKTGSPEAVVSAVRDRLALLDRDMQGVVDKAATGARRGADALGVGLAPEETGSRLRGSLESARAQAKVQERQLWAAVDPDGTLALPAARTRSQVTEIRKSLPKSAKPMSGEEAAIFDAAGAYKGVVPFSELTALQSRIKTEMRAERVANGESPAYRRLTQMNTAIQNDLETAIAGKVDMENQAVAAGTMRAENTLFSALQRETGAWRVGRQTQVIGGNGPTGFVGNTGGRTEGVPGPYRAEGQTDRRPPDASRGSGIPSDEPLAPNFDAEALGRLNIARTATRERAETFDNKTLAPLRKRPSTTAPYDVSDSAVAAKLFKPGSNSFDAIRTYRQAVGDPAAMQAMEGYAVDRLRKAALRDDGTLDPSRVESFRRLHADALRAFPALDARFTNAAKASETLAEVTRARKAALDGAQRSQLGKLLGIDAPSDVVRAIGGVFQSQDSVRRMLMIRKAVGKNKEAKEGLRKAVVDHMLGKLVGNTEAATSGIGTMKSDQFQTFVRQNSPALSAAGFSGDEIKTMGWIAEDLRRANRSLAAVKIPGQSNTVQDAWQISKNDGKSSMLTKAMLGIGIGGGAAVGGPFSAVVGGYAAAALKNMRLAGIEKVDDLLADALLNPARAKLLLATPSRQTTGRAWQMLGTLYRRAAVVSGASSLDGNGSGTERQGRQMQEALSKYNEREDLNRRAVEWLSARKGMAP